MSVFFERLKFILTRLMYAVLGFFILPLLSIPFNFVFKIAANIAISSVFFAPIRNLVLKFFPNQPVPETPLLKDLIQVGIGFVASTLFMQYGLGFISFVLYVDLFVIKPLEGLYYGFTEGFDGVIRYDVNRYSILFNVYHKIENRYGSFKSLLERLIGITYDYITGQTAPDAQPIAARPILQGVSEAPAQRSRPNRDMMFNACHDGAPDLRPLTGEEIDLLGRTNQLLPLLTNYVQLRRALIDAQLQSDDPLFGGPIRTKILLFKTTTNANQSVVVDVASVRVCDEVRLRNHLQIRTTLPQTNEAFFDNHWHWCYPSEAPTVLIQTTNMLRAHLGMPRGVLNRLFSFFSATRPTDAPVDGDTPIPDPLRPQ